MKNKKEHDCVGKIFWHEGNEWDTWEGYYRAKFYDDEISMFRVEGKNENTGEWHDRGWFWPDSVTSRVS